MGMDDNVAPVALEDATKPVYDPVVYVLGVLGEADYESALP